MEDGPLSSFGRRAGPPSAAVLTPSRACGPVRSAASFLCQETIHFHPFTQLTGGVCVRMRVPGSKTESSPGFVITVIIC